jgi:replicative DNA helicase
MYEIDLGKMPPQAIDIEESILGIILTTKNAIEAAIDLLKPESFYKDAHQIVYSECLNLYKKVEPIDILTITEALRKTGKLETIGGPLFLSKLTSTYMSVYNVAHYAKIIADKYSEREIIRIGTEMQRDVYSGEKTIEEISHYAQTEIFNLIISKKNGRFIREIGNERLNEIEEICKSDKKISGITSGFKNIDTITSGWQKQDYIIIAGRPSMGKTTLALEFVINAVDMSFPVDFYSLEMSETQLYDKVLSRKTGITTDMFRNGLVKDHQWEQINNVQASIDAMKLFIDDTPALNILEFRAKARRNKIRNNTQLIVIDYLQLMKSPDGYKKGGREQEISDISGQIKATAKELDIPIIALSQLNRAVEIRAGDKRPQLSDLRESGTLEQDADMVIFINRPEKYGFLEDQEGNSTVNLIETIIAKHRNGATGEANIYKNDTWTHFSMYRGEVKSYDNFYESIEPNEAF